MEELKIRQELERILREDPNNYNKIIELSTKLSAFDKNNIRFSIDAGIIDRLGSELVARQETAVSELVKNAYDADATQVDIIFENTDVIGGTLHIKDNGTGMNRIQLINGFMRLSSSSKIHNPTSEIFGRKRAGQKGIGRFAVQRLGKELTIITQTKEDEQALVVSINWDEYATDTDLGIISNRVTTRPKEHETGTSLIINGLRDKWSEASIRRIYNYVMDILQPFPLSKNEEINHPKEEIVDPGFKVLFSKIINNRTIKIADEKNMVYNHATAIIDGSVDEDGNGLFWLNSAKLDMDEIGSVSSSPDEENVPFSHLKKCKI